MKRRLGQLFKNAIRWGVNGVLRAAVWQKAHSGGSTTRGKEAENSGPMRILLLDGAHIGDAILATSLVQVLRSAYPQAEIGCAAGSWSAEVFRNHPGISVVHTVDHWRLNRSQIPLAAKLKQFARTRHNALAEIRAQGYAMAFALRPWHPDFLDLAWQAGIPIRVGFRRSLLAPLATVLARYPEDEETPFRTHGQCQAELLRAVGINELMLAQRRSWLAPCAEASEEVRKLVREAETYSVIHIGSGSKAKELPHEFWREHADALAAEGMVVFTGYGAREMDNVEAILRAVKHPDRCINACGKLTWQGFVEALRQARTVYGVDSAAAHAAAAVGTPCVAVYSGIGGVGRWRPEGDQVTVWSNPVACSPCHLKNGCSEMRCMRGVEPVQILNREQ